MEVLTELEFDILTALEEKPESGLAGLAEKWPAQDMEKTAQSLLTGGCIAENADAYSVTEKGLKALEPYRVKRGILLAAGLGSRMRPLTLEKPKPLVSVNGRVLIETLIQALLEKEIEDITIVTGYLSEQFSYLKEKYPMVKLLYNPNYETQNNIASAMLVKDLYAGAYVMDADLLLKNADLISKYQYAPNYLGIWVPQTDDWRLEITDGRVTNMVQGGEDAYLMVGLSYWNEETGSQFARDVETLYNRKNGKQYYWDDVALTQFNDHYDIRVRPCKFDDIIEIDSIKELAELDHHYDSYVK